MECLKYLRVQQKFMRWDTEAGLLAQVWRDLSGEPENLHASHAFFCECWETEISESYCEIVAIYQADKFPLVFLFVCSELPLQNGKTEETD